MKKLIVLLVLFSIGVQGQVWDREYWVSFTYKAAKGQEAAFEKAVKEKTKKFNQTPENAIFTFEIMNGENTGTLWRFVPRKTRAFFDQDSSKELNYWSKNVGPYVGEESGQVVWIRYLNASHNFDNPNRMPKKYYRVTTYFVKPGQTDHFMLLQERLAKLSTAYGFTGERALFRAESGDNPRKFMSVLGYDAHEGDMKWTQRPEGKMVPEMYDDMFGNGAWETDFQAANEALETWQLRERIMFRPDLSFGM